MKIKKSVAATGRSSEPSSAVSPRLSVRPLWILVFFFLSGMTALTYEILWMRMISRTIGAAPFAVSTILVIFMGGLGIGSYLAGRKADRLERQRLIRIYGFLELGIGLYALCVPVWLWLLKAVFAASYDRLLEYTLLYNLLIFAGAVVLLIVPAVFMGATLPILCRFYIGSLPEVGTGSGRLYGINTIGGAAGSLLCGFWLIAVLGVYGTLFVAVCINIGIGLICLHLGKNVSSHQIRLSRKTSADSRHADRDVRTSPAGGEPTGALIIFAVSGFCAMAYQVLWTKLLGLMIGPTTYSFTMVLVTFIVALAAGNVVFGVWADRTRQAFRMLIVTQVLAAVAALFASQVMGQSQLFFAKLLFAFSDSFVLQHLIKALSLFAFMMIPTFLLGACFPLAVKIYTRSLSAVGNSVGVAYTVNTAGAVAGSFCAGFVLIPLLGKEMSLSVVTGIQLACASMVAFWVGSRQVPQASVFARGASILALCAGLALCALLPSWNRLTLATGKYHRFEELRIAEVVSGGPGWLASLFRGAEILALLEPGQLVYYSDGIGGFTTVLKYAGPMGDVEFALANSGKMDASSRGDMKTQTLLAHFPLLFASEAKTVMVLGLASGITAGEALHYPVERVDVVDINDRVFEAAAFFNPWNNGVLTDPRIRLIVQDGMAHLTLSANVYDVIISEPSNPWMAGMASLFTREFFTLAKNRLTSEGIYVQWFHCYQMDWETFSLVGRTFADVFPRSVLVTADPAGLGRDYLLVGFKGESGLDMAVAGERIHFTHESANIRLARPDLLYRMIVAEDLKTLFGEGPLNEDDRPALEYAAPKLMYGGQAAQEDILRQIITRRTVSVQTAAGLQKVLEDPAARVDFAQYALSVYAPFAGMVDERTLSGGLKERYARMIRDYCARNSLDSSILSDAALQKSCRAGQIAAIEAYLDETQDAALSHYFLGRLYQEEGDFPKAMEHYGQSLSFEERNADRLNDFGTLLEDHGHGDEARAQFARALRLRPDFLLATGNMAYSYLREGRLDQAAAYFERTLALRPDLALSHYHLGEIALRKNNERQAVGHLRAALRLDADMPEALQVLALVLATSRDPAIADPAAAVAYATRAWEATGQSEAVHLATLAVALSSANDKASAKRTAVQATKLAKAKSDRDAAAILEKYLPQRF